MRVELGLHIWPHNSLSSLHGGHPLIRGRDVEQGDHCVDDVVEIVICIHPLASNVQTIETRKYIGEVLELRVRLRIALIKTALEKADSNDPKDEHKQQLNDNDVDDSWHRQKKSRERYFETLIIINHANGSEHSEQTEYFYHV